MEQFINYSVLIAGVWLTFSALLVSAASDIYSRLFFKVIPFFIGLSCLISAGHLFGFL